ncbi:hypothetical protein JR316_0011123 [Psilocybe cubensis]|uniref:Uncharacterized protein n=3 Tax=Psilocybe cubensis TaxID=181762 RepID=A0A8H7XLZ0_PSICU|nr:hypothetical protein JR316_0011119 [Psilocybe cubensis]XP_047744829.1 hypothetical protein JR316_0011123 [Psilocybe cubensis]KAH9477200.1 hypothetical protein JR316_0011119 [Psilocybe cubensis]KAH9477204.1 hypothetical protein JR316_0011123 [Psilocybe cubensis]
MQFTTKFTSFLVAIASTAAVARSSVIARNDLAALSVVFFDDTNLRGSAYSPDGLVQSVCSTLPGDWLDRAESVEIASGFTCTFFEFQGCEGPGTTLSGTIMSLPDPSLYNNVESFSCNKAV